MRRKTDESELQPTNSDFSTNARMDILEKYSRFYGNSEFSVWYNSPNLKYTDGFRDLVYQISPYNLTCVYKKMFEQYSIYNLRIADDDGTGVTDDEFFIEFTNFNKESGSPTNGVISSATRQGGRSVPGTPRSPHELVDRSNSCVYSAASGIQSKKCQLEKSKHVSGWRTCERPHSSGYHSQTSEESKEMCRRQGKSASVRVPISKTFQDSLRSHRFGGSFHSGQCKNDSTSAQRKSVRERGDEAGSQESSISVMSCNISPIKVGRHFKHFRRSHSYIDQYREEYTYKKLRDYQDHSKPIPIDVLVCACGNTTCLESLTSARCINRWYPSQSHSVKQQNITVCEKVSENVTSGVPVPKRTPVAKTRPQQFQAKHTRVPAHILAPKLDEAQRNGTTWVRENTNGQPKLEFYATSLMVNSYSPVMSHTAQLKSASPSQTSVIRSGSGASLSNQHGPICSPAPQVHSRRELRQNVRGVN